MTWSDPAVWGPILVAVTVYFSANGIMKIIHAANMDRMDDHRKLMAFLDDLPHELSTIKMNLEMIEQHTQPEGDMLD